MTPPPDTIIEAALGGFGDPPDAEWRRMREALAARAEADGLVDVAYELHDSPLGRLIVGATPEGLVRVGLPSEDEDEVLQQLSDRISRRVLRATRPSLTRTRHELDEYFEGTRRDFDVPLDWRLAQGFRREVLRATADIPYGQTSSYRDVATRAGSPRAVRAAGTALATNPLPIVVPCHRVLRTGGALGSYRGGTAAKAALLELEASRGV
jgi:methylated-DNA-[protein]-cysteine S-methyltransferase